MGESSLSGIYIAAAGIGVGFIVALLYPCIVISVFPNPTTEDEKYKKKTLLINAALIACSGFILAFSPLSNVFTYIAVIVFGGAIAQLIYGFKKLKTIKNNVIRQQEEAIRKAQAAQYDDFAQKFYKKCREKGITQDDVYDGTSAFMLIAGSFGLRNRNEAAEYYGRGKELAGKEDIAIYNKNRQNEIDRAFESYNNAQIIGKDKYLSNKKELYRQTVGMIDLCKSILNSKNPTAPIQHDSAIVGGLMEGLFGTGAGIYAAANIHKSNVESQIAYQKRLEQVSQSRASASQGLSELTSLENELGPQIEEIENKLFDDSNIEEKFKMLSVTRLKCKVTDYKNIVVTGEVKLKSQPNLLDSDAALDGSLLIRVFNSKQEIVGVGYYCAGGFGETNLKTVGFNGTLEYENRRKIEAMCYIENTSLVNKNETYTAKAEPYHLWLIEV